MIRTVDYASKYCKEDYDLFKYAIITTGGLVKLIKARVELQEVVNPFCKTISVIIGHEVVILRGIEVLLSFVGDDLKQLIDVWNEINLDSLKDEIVGCKRNIKYYKSELITVLNTAGLPKIVSKTYQQPYIIPSLKISQKIYEFSSGGICECNLIEIKPDGSLSATRNGWGVTLTNYVIFLHTLKKLVIKMQQFIFITR